MNFYDYQDSWPLLKLMFPSLTRDQMYPFLAKLHNNSNDTIGRAHLQFEMQWMEAKRPFYRVWPKVLPMLTRLDVSQVHASACKLPNGLNSLLVQLPHGNGLAGNGQDLQVLLVCMMQTSRGHGVAVGSMGGKTQNGIRLVDMWLFPHSDKPLSVALDELKVQPGQPVNQAIRNTVISLVTTLCLLQNDPELISPVLLSKDDGKLDLTQEDIARLAEKARRRGRYGFDVGKHIEVMPHYRRPHPALVWTGEGRKIPRVVLRKGAVVHRSKIENIPTGYLDNERSD